ncbi:MAG: DNA-binding protein [Leptolyngbya sp. PLA3]|nr:MAG: DNA-binding protein [Cyanobacteria bacterium CYA]MCE7969527.1 DNA-binding protein [Leptolyngbya sp. PL-A3]
MAKMFYTLEETAAKLGMSVDEVRQLASSGQLQEFRDRDRLMFKVDQVDLLAGGGDDANDIPLADSGDLEPIGLSSSGTGSVFAVEDVRESSGVSIFEPEAADADPSAQTQVNPSLSAPSFVADSGASGSGLLDFTREPDDTSLGADLLEDVYSSSGSRGSAPTESAIGGSGIAPATSGELFEPAGGQAEMTGGSALPIGLMAGEAYDGPWSGIVGGLALGMVVLLGLALAVAIFGMTGAAGAVLSSVDSTVRWGIVGGGAGLMLIAAIVGWVALRRS